jgi:hypothetical protein
MKPRRKMSTYMPEGEGFIYTYYFLTLCRMLFRWRK